MAASILCDVVVYDLGIGESLYTDSIAREVLVRYLAQLVIPLT